MTEPTKEDWAEYSNDYDRAALALLPYHLLLSKHVAAIRANVGERTYPVIIDVGCGSGNILLELTRQRFPCHYIGLDFSADMLGYAEPKAEKFHAIGGNTAFYEVDLNASPDEWGVDLSRASAGICNNVLYALQDPARTLANLAPLFTVGAALSVSTLLGVPDLDALIDEHVPMAMSLDPRINKQDATAHITEILGSVRSINHNMKPKIPTKAEFAAWGGKNWRLHEPSYEVVYGQLNHFGSFIRV